MPFFQSISQTPLPPHRGGREKAEGLLALAGENGFPYWAAIGSIHLGQVALQEGSIEPGINAILEGREMSRAGGDIVRFQLGNWWLAEAYLVAGRSAEGLAAVSEAIAAADQVQMRFSEAELHRLKGELLLLAGAPESEAEASMRRAIAIAQRQEAKGLGVARRHQPRSPAAQAGANRRGARRARAGVQLVHRGLRYRRLEGCQGSARGAWSVSRCAAANAEKTIAKGAVSARNAARHWL